MDGHRPRLAQVLTNLLSNALEYTLARRACRGELSAGGGEAWLTVRDDGIGFEPGRSEEPGGPCRSRHAGGPGAGARRRADDRGTPPRPGRRAQRWPPARERRARSYCRSPVPPPAAPAAHGRPLHAPPARPC
ncbi:ATP-binding protein [Streptomyces sp. NPDC003015]